MSDTSSANAPEYDTAELVRAFLASATSDFSPLMADPDSCWAVSVEHFTGQSAIAVSPEQITHVFLATATFENALVSGTIQFGDREFSVDTVLGPARSSVRYNLSEWADALDKPTIAPQNTDFVLTVDRLATIVGESARAVSALQSSIAVAPTRIIARIESARATAQAAFQARLHENEHRTAANEAADAFRRLDYPRVVTLLEPFREILTASERKKLSYARARL